MVVTQPSLEEFETEVCAFLQAYPRKRASGGNDFLWGAGDDKVALFDEIEPRAELEHIDAVRRWRGSLAAANLSWITGPLEFGGRELPRRYQRLFDMRSRDYDVPDSAKLTVSMGMVAPTIFAHGQQSAKEKYLRAIFAAELIGCQLFSEPGAGSDLAGVTTRAVQSGDSWRVTGQKVWTSGAHFSDIGLLLCRTADGPRHKNLTVFVIDMHAAGVDVRPLRQMTGGAAFNEVFLEDVMVGDGDRLGAVNDGWRVALITLLNERAAIGGAGMGGSGLLSSKRLLAMLRHFGVDQDPLIRQQFGRLMVGLRSAQASRYRAEAKIRAGKPPGPELSLSKLALAYNLQQLSDLVAQVLGPRLAVDTEEWGTYSWSSFVLGVPGYRLGGGTDEILRNIIAERVLGLPRELTESAGGSA
jgi:alkylation response protein AidB-like acyl-CoA dehydrogenase